MNQNKKSETGEPLIGDTELRKVIGAKPSEGTREALYRFSAQKTTLAKLLKDQEDVNDKLRQENAKLKAKRADLMELLARLEKPTKNGSRVGPFPVARYRPVPKAEPPIGAPKNLPTVQDDSPADPKVSESLVEMVAVRALIRTMARLAESPKNHGDELPESTWAYVRARTLEWYGVQLKPRDLRMAEKQGLVRREWTGNHHRKVVLLSGGS